MTEIKAASLFGKLNQLGYQTIDSATTFCEMRRNPYVELVHWLHQLLILQNSDLHRIIEHFEIDHANLKGSVKRLPVKADIGDVIQESLIVELYSK